MIDLLGRKIYFIFCDWLLRTGQKGYKALECGTSA